MKPEENNYINIIENFNIKVLYSKEYFERDLFVLQINDKTTNVYRSSGLNAGRKGRFLPFSKLFDRMPRFSEAIRGINVGWISKDFFYNGVFTKHYKNMNSFGDDVVYLLNKIEELLKDEKPENSNYTVEDLKNPLKMIEITTNINKEMEEVKEDLKEFDWKISNKIIEEEIQKKIRVIVAMLSRRASSTFAVDTNISEFELNKEELKEIFYYLDKQVFIKKDGTMLLRKYLSFEQDRKSEFEI